MHNTFRFSLLITSLFLGVISMSQQVQAADELVERSATNPTAWKWYYNITASSLKSQLSKGYRIVDLEVVNAPNYRFNAALVKNSGVHKSAWWWYYGINSNQLKNFIQANKARLIDLESYYIGNTRYFAAVMIKNSGARASGWWYYYGQTLANVSSKLSQNKARLVDIDTYVRNGVRYYDAIMLPNTGTNAKAWWWYTNITAKGIKNKLSQHKARLVNIERQSNGRYTVVMYKNNGKQWWWHYGVTASTVSDFVAQKGARIFDLESYTVNGARRFNVIYLNNVNAQTSRVRDLIAKTRSGGAYGLYVKQVNGSVKAQLQAGKKFEPASSIKALHHIHGMRRVYLGLNNISNPVFGFADYVLGSGGDNTSCPQDSSSIVTSRANAHSKMMEQSDNRWTQALRVAYGENALNSTALALGMTNSGLAHRIGCGSDQINNPNQLTLVDAGKLYEKSATGYLGFGSTRKTFRNLMSNGTADINIVIDQEAAKLGLSSSKTKLFKGRVQAAAKAGSYTINSKKYKSIAGWVSLPIKSRTGSIQDREYVQGAFVDKANSTTIGIWGMRGEMLREQIRYALLTYKLF